MADAVVNIGVVVDKAAVADGMDQASGAVDQATVKMGVSFANLQGRAKNTLASISADTKTAAASISEESQKIAQATIAVAKAQQELRAATSLTRIAQIDQAQSTALLAAAQEKARNTAAELAAVQKLVQESSHKAITDVQATSAAVRSFEGNPGIRAMENFVGRTLGLGPALQAVFPIIGAAAFLGVIGDVVMKIGDIAYEAQNAGRHIAAAFNDLHDKAELSTDALEITNQKLKDQIDKLTGRPNNGLALAMDEARERADKLLVSLQADRKELAGLLKEHSVSTFGEMLTGVRSTGQQEREIDRDENGVIASVRAAKMQYVADVLKDGQEAATAKYNAAVKKSFQSRIDTWGAETTRLVNEQEDSTKRIVSYTESGAAIHAAKIDNSAKIQNLIGATDRMQKAMKDALLDQEIAANSVKVGALKGDRGSSEGANKVDEERFKQAEEQLARLKTQGAVTKQQELAFWSEAANGFRQGTAQYREILQREGGLTQEIVRQAHEGIAKFKAEETRRSAEEPSELEKVANSIAGVNKLVQVQAEDVTRSGERWDAFNKAVSKGAEMQAQFNFAMQEAQVRTLEAMGGIAVLGAAQRTAALHTQEHIEKLKLLQAELERLTAERDKLKPGDKGYPEANTKVVDAQNAVQQEQGAVQLQSVQDVSAVANAMAKPYLAAFDAINSGWLKVQNDLIQGNRNIRRDFAQMGLHLVQEEAASAERMLAAYAQSQIKKLAFHAATTNAGTAVTAAGAAQADSISAISALKQANHAAAVAAGKAWSAMADIPIVGPELGAVAAAATYAGVMALAAFEKGGVVAGHPAMAVPILAHGGERVLTAAQTQRFESMVNSSTSSHAATTINLGGNHSYQGGGANDFRSQMREHRVAMAREIKSLVREGHLSINS